MRILITGGAGFIGSHLCDRLLRDGNEVISVDNLITGASSNIEHLQTNKHFRFIRHDMSKPLELADAVDYILHFASPASPPRLSQVPDPNHESGIARDTQRTRHGQVQEG